MHAGTIGCTMLVLLPHKFKVGHIDLIPIYHHNLLNSPEIPEFSYVSHLFIYLLIKCSHMKVHLNFSPFLREWHSLTCLLLPMLKFYTFICSSSSSTFNVYVL